MSQYLFLASEGVFPVTKDVNGKILHDKPATGFDIPGTIQGEGKQAGMPSLFLRLAGCNLRCMWQLPNGEISICDTSHASFNTELGSRVHIDDVAKKIINNLDNIPLLIISGVEPLLQAEALNSMLEIVKNEKTGLQISIETNGTIFNPDLAELLNFFSLSPKLKNALPSIQKIKEAGVVLPSDPDNYKKLQINIPVIQSYLDLCKNSPRKDFQLKFVIGSENEVEEINSQYLHHLKEWKNEDIVLMPLGSTPEELAQTRLMAMKSAIKYGYRYTPRLQVTYFRGKAGV